MAVSRETVEAIIRLKGEGKTEPKIAEMLGITRPAVRHICYSRVIKKPNEGRFDIILGPRIIDVYRQQASKRGVPVQTIAQRMLRTIAQENLFDAVLDDGK